MNCLLKIILLSVAVSALAAPGVTLGHLGCGRTADTEASTNVPFAFPQQNVKHFLLSLELAGTPSNNVQVAFGRDANANGVLEIEETGFAIGWDCGRWRVREGIGNGERGIGNREWTAEEVTTNRVKALDVDLQVSKARGKSIVCTENGEAIDWGEDRELPRTMYDNGWDTLRLTVRGVDRADESLRAAVRVEGTIIFVQ